MTSTLIDSAALQKHREAISRHRAAAIELGREDAWQPLPALPGTLEERWPLTAADEDQVVKAVEALYLPGGSLVRAIAVSTLALAKAVSTPDEDEEEDDVDE